MKKIIIAAFALLLTTASITAQKIAIVDINEVLASMPEYKAAEGKIDQKAAEWRQEVSQKYDKIKSLYNKYQAEQVLLTEDSKRERENEIVEMEEEARELQKRRFGPDGDLFKERQQVVAPIQDKVFAAIESYASDRGYDIIFDKAGSAGLLFVGADFDKTADIIRRVK